MTKQQVLDYNIRTVFYRLKIRGGFLRKNIVAVSFLAHLWCAYAMVLCLSWIVRRAVGGVCVEHNYPKMWMD